MLAELVKAGKLPPVDQRLPANPCVVQVVDKTGKYGGNMRRGFKGVSDINGPAKVQQMNLYCNYSAIAAHSSICQNRTSQAQ